MLKYIKYNVALIFFLFLGLSVIYANEGICYTDEEVLAIDNYISELEDMDSINVKIIDNLEYQLDMYIYRIEKDSSLKVLKDNEILLLENQVNNYKELNVLIKPKWYEKPLFFVSGFLLGTIYGVIK